MGNKARNEVKQVQQHTVLLLLPNTATTDKAAAAAFDTRTEKEIDGKNRVATSTSNTIMSDLCGSSENLISIVNCTLRRKGEYDDKNATASIGTASTTRQIAMSNNDAAEEPSSTSPPPETRQEKNDAEGGDDNNNDGGDAEQKKEGSSDNKKEGSTNEAGSDRDDEKEEQDGDKDLISAVSDLSDVTRRICVVTTAALPWRYVKIRKTSLFHIFCLWDLKYSLQAG